MRPAFTAPALLSLLFACGGGEAPPAPAWTGEVLVADSPQALTAWSQADLAARRGRAGLLEGVFYGQKAFVRAAVTGYVPAAQGEDAITGSLRLRAPDGGVMHLEEVRATAADLDPSAPGVLILRPGLDILFDPGDPVGTYVIEADLRRGPQRLELQQPLRVEAGGDFLSPPVGAPL